MKKTLYVTSAILLFSIPLLAKSTQKEEPIREINFSMKKALACAKAKDVENCLYSIFGKGIGYRISDKEGLREVSFPKAHRQSFRINGTSFKNLNSPKIQLIPELNQYVVCSLSAPVQIGTYLIMDSSGCACGFDDSGKFEHRLEDSYSFLPANARIEVNGRCRSNKFFDASSLTLRQAIFACGYQFPENTEFYDSEEGVEFVVPINGKLETGDGTLSTIYKGEKYVTRSTKEKPCNWQPATYVDPKYQKSD